MLEHLFFTYSFLHKATTLVFDNLRKRLAINIEVHLHKKFRFYEFDIC